MPIDPVLCGELPPNAVPPPVTLSAPPGPTQPEALGTGSAAPNTDPIAPEEVAQLTQILHDAQSVPSPAQDPQDAPGSAPPAYFSQFDEAAPLLSQDQESDSDSEPDEKRKSRASAANPIYSHIEGCYKGNDPWC